MRHVHYAVRFFCGLSAFTLACAFPSSVFAQARDAQATKAGATVTLPAAKPLDFFASLTAVAQQSKWTLVAEGTPYVPLLEDKDAQAVTRTGTAREVLQSVATAFDYEVVSTRTPNLFLLRKRYSDTNELPEVTLEECQHAASSIKKLLDQYLPGEKIYTKQYVLDFIDSLSPEHLAKLQAKSLRMADLGGDQRKQLEEYELYLYLLSPYASITQADRLFSNTATAVLERSQGASPLKIRYTVDRQEWSYPIYATLVVTDNNSTRTESAKLPVEDKTTHVERMTTKALADSLGKRLAPATVTVEESLSTKVVSVFGLDTAPAEAVLRGVAQIYGLRLLQPQAGQFRLTYPAAQRSQNLTDIPQLVRTLMPAPLLTVLREEELKQLSQQQLRDGAIVPQTKEESDEHMRKMNALRKRHEAARTAIQSYGFTASAVVQNSWDKQAASGKKPVPVSEMSPTERRALALMLMVPFAEIVRDGIKPTPPANITRFDDIVLQGGFYDKNGVRKASLHLEVYDKGNPMPLDTIGMFDVYIPPGRYPR